MHFNLIVLTAFSFMLSNVHAQKLEVGPEIGFNLIQLEEEEIGSTFDPGWFAGGTVRYRFFDYFSVISGINYSQKRQTYSSFDTTTFDFFGLIDSSSIPDGIDLNTYYNTSGRTAQHYLEVPLIASYDYKGLSVFYGGYVGFMISARNREVETTHTPFMEAFDPEAIVGDSEFIQALLPAPHTETYTETSSIMGLRKIDYGFKAGIGYQANGVGINATYQFGFPDYQQSPEDRPRKAHRFFQFSLRYMFKIGKKTTANSRL